MYTRDKKSHDHEIELRLERHLTLATLASEPAERLSARTNLKRLVNKYPALSKGIVIPAK